MRNTQTLWNTGRRLAIGLALLVAAPLVIHSVAQAQTDCKVTRSEVLAALERGLSPVELARKYAGCVSADDPGTQPEAAIANQVIKDTGNTFWEAITSCGYHPQRKELTCPIEIRQRFGYGGPPAIQPAGSFEYLQFCVANPGGPLRPVNVSGVHVHDEAFGRLPTWHLSAVVAADADRSPNLFSRPLNGTTLQARAILSWAIDPFGNCQFVPTWGNQADFIIRLDP